MKLREVSMTAQDWYFQVNDYCKTISDTYNVPLIKVAGIMSALSPNTTFALNVKSLENFIKTKGDCKVSTYGNQKIKALAIYNSSDDITVEEIKTILGGLKTQAFFDNIYRPEVSQDVTIDLWMIRHFKIKGSLTPKRYKDASNKIKKLAKELNLLPHQVQAKLWVDIRKNAF
jgi:hypothetical protein